MTSIRLWVLVAMTYIFGAVGGFFLGGAYQLHRATKQFERFSQQLDSVDKKLQETLNTIK